MILTLQVWSVSRLVASLFNGNPQVYRVYITVSRRPIDKMIGYYESDFEKITLIMRQYSVIHMMLLQFLDALTSQQRYAIFVISENGNAFGKKVTFVGEISLRTKLN